MVLLRRLRTIAAKVEAVVGTAETLDASVDGKFNAYNLDTQAQIEVQRREDPASFGRRRGAPGPYGGTMNFRVDMQWDGTATLPAWADVLLPACGYVKTGSIFTPRSEGPGANVKTLTLAAWLGEESGTAVKKTLAGAMGNFTFVLESGMVGAIDFEFTGVWQPVVDDTMPSGVDYPDEEYLRYAQAVTTWQGVSKCVQESNVSAGNEVILRECAAAGNDAGYISALVVDRPDGPSVTTNPEAVLVVTDDVYGDWAAGTEGPLVIALNGPGNSTVQFDMPKAQIMDSQEGDRNKIAIDQIEFAANKKDASTPDEELSITFTPTV